MPEMMNLAPAARQMAALLRGVGDDQLAAATPGEQSALGDLVSHVDGVPQAFTAAAAKDLGPATAALPAPDSGQLGPDM